MELRPHKGRQALLKTWSISQLLAVELEIEAKLKRPQSTWTRELLTGMAKDVDQELHRRQLQLLSLPQRPSAP